MAASECGLVRGPKAEEMRGHTKCLKFFSNERSNRIKNEAWGASVLFILLRFYLKLENVCNIFIS